MRDDAKRARQAEIAEAAYALVGEKGFGGTSMLAVAKRAKASNETLYRWYGDKIGLFTALIEDNAAGVQDLLEDALSKGSDPIETLAALGPRLFELLTSDRAIALNRAAAADGTGELGAALTRAGREKVMPLIAQVIALAEDAGALGGAQPGRSGAALAGPAGRRCPDPPRHRCRPGAGSSRMRTARRDGAAPSEAATSAGVTPCCAGLAPLSSPSPS